MSTSATPNHLRGGGVALGTPPTTSLSGELPGDGRRSPPAKGGPDDETGDFREDVITAAAPNEGKRPKKRRKMARWQHDLGARLLSKSAGKNPPLSLLHKACMDGIQSMGLNVAHDHASPMVALMRSVASDHKYAAMVLRSDRHPQSVLRNPRCFDDETYVWRTEGGQVARYVASGCLCFWCHRKSAPFPVAS